MSSHTHQFTNPYQNSLGSKSLDLFKWFHKNYDPRFAKYHACDIDLILFEKFGPGIVAVLDFKTWAMDDIIHFGEGRLYNWFRDQDVPVWIVKADIAQNGELARVLVSEYRYGDWRPDPPIIEWGRRWGHSLSSGVFGSAFYWRFETWLRDEYRKQYG